jgi:hypothetical protein
MVDKKEIKTGKIDQMDRGEVESRLRSLIDKHGLNVNTTKDVGDVEDAEFEEVIEDEEIEDEVEGSEEDIHDDEEEDEDG